MNVIEPFSFHCEPIFHSVSVSHKFRQWRLNERAHSRLLNDEMVGCRDATLRRDRYYRGKITPADVRVRLVWTAISILTSELKRVERKKMDFWIRIMRGSHNFHRTMNRGGWTNGLSVKGTLSYSLFSSRDRSPSLLFL